MSIKKMNFSIPAGIAGFKCGSVEFSIFLIVAGTFAPEKSSSSPCDQQKRANISRARSVV
jgi:hypothetical protein